jgi:hypothetical protein
MQYAIMYVNHPPFGIGPADWPSAVSEWIGYMTDPAYVLVNGKPLFVVYNVRLMREAFGSSSAVRDALNQLRAAAQAKGFPGAFIVGDFSTIWGSFGNDGLFSRYLSSEMADGYDAVSLYNYELPEPLDTKGAQPFSGLAAIGAWIWKQAETKSPLPFIPVAEPGSDVWGLDEYIGPFWYLRSPGEFAAHVEDAITWAESNPQLRAEPSPEPPIVVIGAWNELGEGKYLLPTVSEGTSYGDALGAMLAAPPSKARTVLTISDSGPSITSRVIAGKLTGAAGAPIAGASIAISGTPASGTYAQYRVSGQPPVGATQAFVGFRVNTDAQLWPWEYAGPGDCDFSLYKVSYVERGAGIERVPNGDFGWGELGWTMQGATRLAPSDRAGWQMVQVVAAPSQSAALDSAPFPITPGAAFEVTFSARAAAKSSACAYFYLAFQDAAGNVMDLPRPSPGSPSAEEIPLTPVRTPIANAITDAAGKYQLSLRPSDPSPVILEAAYAGDAGHWPASARLGP